MKNHWYIVGGVVLFLVWRNGMAQEQAAHNMALSVPTDPMRNVTSLWDWLHSVDANAQPSSNEISAQVSNSFGGFGVCPTGALC